MQLSNESAKLNQECPEHEEAVKKQLSDKEESLRNMETQLCHQWEVQAQQWSRQQRRLEKMLEVKERPGSN